MNNAVQALWADGLQQSASQLNSGGDLMGGGTTPSPDWRPAAFPPVSNTDLAMPNKLRHNTAWYHNMAFQQIVAAVVVFLVALILLVAIRPSFTYTKPKQRFEAGVFSANKAALFALGATVLFAIVSAIVTLSVKRPPAF